MKAANATCLNCCRLASVCDRLGGFESKNCDAVRILNLEKRVFELEGELTELKRDPVIAGRIAVIELAQKGTS